MMNSYGDGSMKKKQLMRIVTNSEKLSICVAPDEIVRAGNLPAIRVTPLSDFGVG